MTADAVIYAVGGGQGHAVRGSVVQDHLRKIGITSELITRATDPLPKPGAILIADTFPLGVKSELPRAWIRAFRRRVLIARFSREPDFDEKAAAYDRILRPYAKTRDEWDLPPARSRPAGYFLKSDRCVFPLRAGVFTVVDPGSRCHPRSLELFRRLASRSGRRFSYRRSFEDSVSGEKILFVGAGYNTFYETMGQPADLRFLPVAKRYDDQFKRARAFGLSVETPTQLWAWLREARDKMKCCELPENEESPCENLREAVLQ